MLDWYTNRNYVVDAIPDDVVSQLTHQQKIVYRVPEKQGDILSV